MTDQSPTDEEVRSLTAEAEPGNATPEPRLVDLPDFGVFSAQCVSAMYMRMPGKNRRFFWNCFPLCFFLCLTEFLSFPLLGDRYFSAIDVF